MPEGAARSTAAPERGPEDLSSVAGEAAVQERDAAAPDVGSAAVADIGALVAQVRRQAARPQARRVMLSQIQARYGNRYAEQVIAELRAGEDQSTEEEPTGESKASEGSSAAAAPASTASSGLATASAGSSTPAAPSAAVVGSGGATAGTAARQPALQRQAVNWISAVSDPAEREADATAKKVVRMPGPDGIDGAATPGGTTLQRKKGEAGAPDQAEPLQAEADPPEASRATEPIAPLSRRKEAGSLDRKASGEGAVPPKVAAGISDSLPSGGPLSASVRGYMEPRFNADFSQVRVHTGERSAQLNRAVNARAFTVGRHVFFGQNQYSPESSSGRELIAHELTHTVQQGAAPQGGEIQRSRAPSITETSPPKVQRLGIGDALDYFAEKAYLIPGFRMFTIILGLNPINMSAVERTAANILRALIEFMPGGGLITMALDNYGVFERAGAWVEQQISSLALTGATIRQSVMDFLNSLSWTDIFDLGGVWSRAKRIFTEPIDRIIAFARGVVDAIVELIKEAILRPLAEQAQGWAGYDLLRAVLGFDPISGDPVERTPDLLIGGFMKMIGQEEVWNNLRQANAVERAWAWFQGVLSGLFAFVSMIPTLFLQALQALKITDIVELPSVIVRVVDIFTNAIGQFASWALQQVMGLLQIIFEVVAPGVMPYIQKAAGAFQTIIRDPIGFVGNLVRAGVQGLNQFATNFLTHLRTSLIEWLTGTLSGTGVHIPQAFSLQEIIKFILSVLGLTWQNIRQKLVRRIGEGAVAAMETGFDLVATLVKEGPAAAWQKIVESISNLREMVMEQIMTFVRNRVVQAAITKLVTSLNPAGAFIQAIIATYNTIMFFVERLRQIARVAMAFIDSIAAIAGGVVTAAANKVERTMAGMLTLVISFLARIAGLGGVSDAVKNIIDRVRVPVDNALERVVDWVVNSARKLGRFVAQAGVPQDPNERLRLAAQAAVTAAQRLSGKATRSLLEPVLQAIKVRYGLREIEPYLQDGSWWVRVAINPTLNQNLGLVNPEDAGQTLGVLDLYRGIHYQDRTFEYSRLSTEALKEQLVREEDFSDAVYSILGKSRAEAPETTRTTVGLALRKAAAQTVANEVQAAHSVASVTPWWETTLRPTLFLAMLQRFINGRTAFQEELRERRVSLLTGFSFTDIPFISITKKPQRAAQYAAGTVVATNVPAATLPSTSRRVVGKVFVYLFSGSDLTALKAADIKYLRSQGKIRPRARYWKADQEVTFTGSIPPDNRVGEVLMRESDSEGDVAGKARRMANAQASGRGGLLEWS